MSEQLQIARLDDTGATKVQDLEGVIGKHVMAFARGPAFANLSPEQVAKVQALEAELGVILLVYDM
jgi:hypothetical protein